MELEMMKEMAKGLAINVEQKESGVDIMISAKFDVRNGDIVRATNIHLNEDFDFVATNVDNAVAFIMSKLPEAEVFTFHGCVMPITDFINIKINGCYKIERSETISSLDGSVISEYESITGNSSIRRDERLIYDKDKIERFIEFEIFKLKPEWKPSRMERLLNRMTKWIRIATYINSPAFFGKN